MNYLRVFSQRCTTAFYLLELAIFGVWVQGLVVRVEKEDRCGNEGAVAGKNDEDDDDGGRRRSIIVVGYFCLLCGWLRVIRRSNISLTIFMGAARVNRQPHS